MRRSGIAPHIFCEEEVQMRRIGSRAVRLLVAAALCSMPVQSFAALNGANTVNSAAIIKADGTSGQTLTTGNGVKTGHIQDGAVTSTKIGAGAVTTTAIASGAVTDVKIVGPISTSKLNIGTLVGTVAAGDHNHGALYQKKYGKVAVVAQTGGDYTTPVAAMNDLATWCGASSETNRCLVKIMPGVFSFSAPNSIQTQPFVDIEGSGENTTVIKSHQCPVSFLLTSHSDR
jgi:hypothetical protein